MRDRLDEAHLRRRLVPAARPVQLDLFG